MYRETKTKLVRQKDTAWDRKTQHWQKDTAWDRKTVRQKEPNTERQTENRKARRTDYKNTER